MNTEFAFHIGISTSQSPERTDVFGFGFLLLEFLAGMRASGFDKSD